MSQEGVSRRTHAWLLALGSWLAGGAACAVTPLTNRIQVGREAFVIGVGEGPDGATDLFAAPAGDGAFVRFTFTRAEERLPRLSPSGTAVAFARRDGASASAGWTLVILDLLTNVERQAALPAAAGAPERIGWRADGSAVILAAQGWYALPAGGEDRTLARLDVPATAGADSLTREQLGDPRFATVVECPGGEVCIAARTGEVTRLGAGASGAIRWGGDSLGYFTARGFEVRPLAGGTSRRPAWRNPPANLRQLTHHPGKR